MFTILQLSYSPFLNILIIEHSVTVKCVHDVERLEQATDNSSSSQETLQEVNF